MQVLSRYYASHNTHTQAEMSIIEEVLPTYFADQPMHPGIQALSYGETPLQVATEIFDWAHLKAEEDFVDLGCGCGAVALLAAQRAHRSTGVDLACASIQFARAASNVLGVANAEFHEQDMLKTDLEPFSVIYCCATAVSEWLALQLSANLPQCRPGTRLITVSYPLRSDRIKAVYDRPIHLSWGNTRNTKAWTFYLHYLDSAP